MMLSFTLGGGAALATLRALWVRRARNPKVCDFRRCIIIIGDDQNDKACIAQRLSLKPHLARVKASKINVIEIYGDGITRRNGQPLDWTDNKQVRRALHAEAGFHLMCIDDDGEIAMRVRLPVSTLVIEELISGSDQQSLPTPAHSPEELNRLTKKTADISVTPTNSWSIGVLR